MNPLIQVTKTTAVLATIALAILTGMGARAAHIGDSVTSAVNSSNAVAIPSNTTTEITHITLDDGVWSISGQINFLAVNPPIGIMGIVGDISVTPALPATNATHAIQTQQITTSTLLVFNVGLPGRVIEVGDGTDVFLLGFAIEPGFPAQGAFGFGYITAVKIRNHVP